MDHRDTLRVKEVFRSSFLRAEKLLKHLTQLPTFKLDMGTDVKGSILKG